MLMVDLFSGRNGWGKEFVKRGWKVIAVDLVEPPEIPDGIEFIKADVMEIGTEGRYLLIPHHPQKWMFAPDFICASSPCEQFSVHGMKHFHPNPKYPADGIRLFEHTRQLCEAVGCLYVMENVRAAQAFVGNARHHAGPFYLWGTGVPPILPGGITKGIRLGGTGSGYGGAGYPILTREQKREKRKRDPMLWASSGSPERKEATAVAATIPPILAACVADYATRICDGRRDD